MKHKRILSVLLTLLMLQLPFLPAMAAEIGDEIPLSNPGFEELEDTWVNGWGHMNTEDAIFEADQTKANSGKTSLHIKTNESNRPWATQSIRGLTPGAFYEMSCYINSDANGQGAGIKLEYYNALGTMLSRPSTPVQYPDGQYITNTNNRFVLHRTVFEMPQEAVTLKIYLRVYGIGEAWYDDVSIRYHGAPTKYSFDTDKVFHYKEETGGDAFVKINEYYQDKGLAENTLVDFTILQGESVCEQAKNIPVKGLEARYTYSTSYMEPYKPYIIKCDIKNAAGEVLETYQQNLYVVDAPSMLDDEGYFMVDGKRFNPVVGYHVNIEDYEKAVEGGINTIFVGHGPAKVKNEDVRAQVMEGLEKHNLKGILALYCDMKHAGHPDNLENTKKIVELLKDNPYIIGYALCDEPFLGGNNPDVRKWSEDAYLAIRQIDKDRPILLTDKGHEYLTVKYCDIPFIDAYALEDDTRSVTRALERTWGVTKDKNAFWELAASYTMNGRYSTANSIRNSVYRAFAEGGRGIGYYCFSDAGGKGVENTQLYKWDLWDDFCKFNNEELPYLYDRFVNGNAIVFNEYDSEFGEAGSESMNWYDWFIGDDMYLVAHNRSRVAQTVTIPLRSKNGKITIGGFRAEPLGLTTKEAFSGNGSIELRLASEEIALFKIIPDQKVDLSKINESSFDDLAGYEWAQEAIQSLDAKSILNTIAEGKYGPGETITRLDFVSFLVRALGLSDEGEAFPDCDVKEVKIARNAGITNGDTDGNFRPYDTITRQDIMTTAARAVNAVATEKEIPVFSDWNLVSDYAQDAVKTMVQAEVILGNGDGTLNPLGLATRAEAAVMLHRILNTEFETGSVTPTPEVPENIKEEIKFSVTPDEVALKTWNNAKSLLSALGVNTPDAEKSVTHGEFEKAIEGLIGTSYDVFSEDLKAITYAEAVEALVKLLGYEAYAPSRGGFMGLAAQLDLTKGVSPEAYIRAGELAVLLKNATDIKIAERTDFGGNEEYRESEDTLLSLYRNIYKVKGTVEETYYTGADVKRGEIILDGVVYTGGEDYHRQRVVAYAEHLEDEKKILYIEAANGTDAVKVQTEDILEADLSKLRYETESGKDELVSITGAAIYVNGEKRTAPKASDLRPEMGTVTLIYTNGSVTSILVEKYENRIVQSIFKEDNTVYFKNGKELVLEKDKGRFYMDFEVAALKEWNVLSVMMREDGSLYKVILSTESVSGEPAEISADGILVGDKTYPVAKTCLGTPVLGTNAKFYLDFSGKIAAVNDKNTTPEYGVLTSIEAGKGLNGGISFKIFTKNGELKVFSGTETVNVNGDEKNPSEIIKDTNLMDGNNAIQQLVIYDLNGEEKLIEIQTAKEALNVTHAKVPEGFVKIYNSGEANGAANHYIGYNVKTIASKYRIGNDTVTFTIPETASNDVRDYDVRFGTTGYPHGGYLPHSDLYDWHEDYTIGALVQKVPSGSKTVATGTQSGFFVGFINALGEDGMIKKGVRIIPYDGQEKVYYVEDDFRVMLDNKTLTDKNKGETEVTKNEDGSVTLNPTMPITSLNKGDIVQYETGGMDGLSISAMRAVFRANSPLVGESAVKGVKEFYNYSNLTIAYGPVIDTLPDGVVLLPGSFERIFLHYQNGGRITPVIIYDKASDKITISTVDAVREGDMVFCRRTNPFLDLLVVYR